MHRLMAVILLFCMLVSMLSACSSDAREIDDLAYIVAIGIEKGVTDKGRLTVEFPTMHDQTSGGTSVSTGSSTGGQGGYETVTVDAPSFYAGMDLLDTIMPRHINFQHIKFIVISEELARSGLVGEFLAPLIRFREVRRTTNVLVSRCSPMDFLKANKPLIGSAASKAMDDLLAAPSDTGYFPLVSLNDFYDDLKATYNQPIATLASLNTDNNFKQQGSKWGTEFKPAGEEYAGEIPKTGGSKIELFGTAVFDGDMMVGELNGEETRLMLMARGEYENGKFTIQDPEKPELVVPLEIRPARKPEIKIKLQNDKPIINLTLYLEGDILAIQSRINYESKDLKPLLEKSFEAYIKTRLDNLMGKCKTLKADVFKFGFVAARQFFTIQEWEKYNWISQFEKAEINTNVRFVIRRTGTMMRSSHIITTKGKE
ncbi:MAG TPA: Ger(x)C family spore germination protein [Pseudobacteroides sp.]|uniref:Ger(x)C family spore germination protein n=1 Tax=Pseudobacteroides sp. TaxID=1968840 RepID=UPI002F93E460